MIDRARHTAQSWRLAALLCGLIVTGCASNPPPTETSAAPPPPPAESALRSDQATTPVSRETTSFDAAQLSPPRHRAASPPESGVEVPLPAPGAPPPPSASLDSVPPVRRGSVTLTPPEPPPVRSEPSIAEVPAENRAEVDNRSAARSADSPARSAPPLPDRERSASDEAPLQPPDGAIPATIAAEPAMTAPAGTVEPVPLIDDVGEASRTRASERRSEEPQTTEQRSVEPGQRFVVRLPGRSWLFSGSERDIELLGRRTEEDATVFEFRSGPRATVVELRFEAQDLTTGERRVAVERVTVGDGEPGRSTATQPVPGSQQPPLGQAPSSSSDTGSADGQAAAADGQVEEAPAGIVERLRGEGDPTTELVSEIALAIRSQDAALEEVDSSEMEQFAGRAEAALGEGEVDPAGYARLLEALLDFGYRPRDRYLFALAQLHDVQGPLRDVRRARELYGEIVTAYPLSSHWTPSRNRAGYLDRHFLDVR